MHTSDPSLPEVHALDAEVQPLPERARQLAITDEPTFAAARLLLDRIKTLQQAVASLLDPHIRRAFEAHRALVADRRRLEAPLEDAEGILKRTLAAFLTTEEARRAREARRQAIEA